MSAELTTEGTGEERQAEVSLGDILAMMRRRLWLIIAVTVAATAVAVAFAYSLTPIYEASATVLVDNRKKAVLNPFEQVMNELPADTPTVESEVELIRSNGVMLAVIEELKLREEAEFSGGEKKGNSLLKALGLAQEAAPERKLHQNPDKPDRDEVLAEFATRLKVQRKRNSYLIEVSFASQSAVQSARIVNAVVNAYIKSQLEAKMKQAGMAAEWLAEKLERMRLAAVAADHRVAEFKSKNTLIDTEHGQRLDDKELARLLEQAVLARTQVAEARAKYEQVQRLMKTPGARAAIADVLDSHTVRMLKDQLVKATRREAELVTRYGDRHPELIKARAEVRDVEIKIDLEVDQIVANYKSAYEVAATRERTLTQNLEKLKLNQAMTNDVTVRLKDLEREAHSARQVYEAFLTRYKNTVEQQTMQYGDSRITETATTPLNPASPKRKKIMLLGFAGGLGLALLLAFALEMMQPGLARPEDFEAATKLAHLASVPKLEEVGKLGETAAALRRNRLIVVEPEAQFCEAIRALRHALDRRSSQGKRRVIMVTSALPHEGKSAITSNLAHHYSLSGARTLLIDGDLRRASLTRSLCTGAQDVGLLESLLHRMPVEEAILVDESTGFCFLPAHGASPPRVSVPEVLASVSLKGMLDRLRDQFDIIMVDCPPVLPVVDARIVADHVDQIAFLMRWKKTPKELARRAIRNLSGNGEKLAGLIVNEVDPRDYEATYSYRVETNRKGKRNPSRRVTYAPVLEIDAAEFRPRRT
ncbi:MAG: AAA family ATPase [Hyphomicrobiaceae bacterium]|nr:MAG: AAA family ATPase [Hyphomicrobiaceae bacterium]